VLIKKHTKLFAKVVRRFIFLLLCLYSLSCFAQTEQRIKFTTISSSINTGQDYSPWLNDNLDSLVQDDWQPANFAWVDVTLKLTQHSILTRFSLYDYTGVFTDQPDSIYALNGTTKTFLGVFTGPNYMVWDALNLPQTIEADAIIIHKYCNNIPEKVDIYGYPDGPPFPVTPPPADTTDTITTPPPAVKTPADSLVLIPIDTARWYQLDNVTNGLGGLFDGDTTTSVFTGWGKIIANYDAYYPVLPGEKIDLYKIKFYSYEGGLGDYPLIVSVVDSTGKRTNIATYVGGVYNTWVGPNPANGNNFMLDSIAKNIKYIVLNSWYQLPTEMQFYGHYTPPPADTTTAVKQAYPLQQYFGINAFEWDFEDPTNPTVVDPHLMEAVKSFRQVRHYMDWDKLESTQGKYTFNPVHSGGWNYDAIYSTCKSDSVTVLADLKAQPNWMTAAYPSGQQDPENVPVPYGSDFSDPNSYILQAKVAFQYAARYGDSKLAKKTLLSVDTSMRWTNDPKNTVREDLKYVSYIECDNERDKWWKGRNAYQTAYEYAANLSAFYDGNKNTMGPGVGVKNADPDMQVVMGGLASADPSYVHGMIEWCKQHRGYNPDGSVNLCWDVINYHLYNSNSTPMGNATTGAAPELSVAAATARKFIKMSHQYANDMPVWVTESGYDVNQGSPQRAPAIGSKTAAEVQADWILRTSLLYAREGIARLFFYEEYDDNAPNPTQYESSGLINTDQSRRPAADFLYQANKLFGAYTYKQTINSDPIVDVYQLNGQNAYVLTVPDQVGRTATYALNLGGADSARVYIPAIGKGSMTMTKVKVTGGLLSVKVTETPTFVVPITTVVADVAKLPNQIINTPPDNSITLYPNPTSRYATIAINNNGLGPVTINVTDVSMGRVYATYTSTKYGADFSQTIDISNVPMGMCLIQVTQGGKKTVKKVIKTN